MSKMVESAVELVVTAPEPFGASLAYRIRCRTTIGVLTQIIAESASHIIIASPFMQPGYGLSAGTLADALRAALKRGVNVDVLSTDQSLQTIDRASLMHEAKGKIRFFQAVFHNLDGQQLGSHAKFCIADGELAYVGSANLTGRGLSGQVEMGVLIHGPVAHQIKEFWDYGLDCGLFVQIE